MTAGEERALDAALEAIARRSPGAADRAGHCLRTVLGELRSAPAEQDSWHASRLTGDGYPVELTFSSTDRVLRWTSAPWPWVPPAARLARAIAFCAARGTPLPPATRRRLAGLSTGGEASWGAWLGGRHDEDDPSADRVKLYVEVTGHRAWVPDPAAGPTLADRPVRHRISAVDAGTGSCEDYYRVESPARHHLPQLLRHVGCEDRAEEVLDLLAQATGRPTAHSLPGGAGGFSVATGPGQPPVFVLFAFARSLWGGDRRVRRGVLRLAAERGWDLGAYAQVSAPCAGRDVHATWHGMVGVIVVRGRPLHLTVGLRPPPGRAA